MPVVPLAGLLGQSEVSRFLRQVVASGRYGNAYLLHGPAGVGKGTAALAFARAALCDHVPGAAPREAGLFDAPALPIPAPGDDACGACEACRKSAQLIHPDLKLVFTVSGSEKDVQDSEEGAIVGTFDGLRQDPLFVFQYDKAASIRMFQTRALQRELAYRPFEASRRVVVVRDCDRMREDQYSTLLKAIEEPGANTLWVLTTSRLARVPATIRSRCQRVRLMPLTEAAIRGVLERDAGVSAQESRLLAALSNGSLAHALVQRGVQPSLERDAAMALLEPARRGDATALWKAVQQAAGFGRTSREKLRRLIEHQQLWLRDLLRLRYGASEDHLVHRDRVAALRAEAAVTDAQEVRRRLLVLEEAIRAIDGNVSVDLTLFSTLSRVAGRRVGERAWPPHAAGRAAV